MWKTAACSILLVLVAALSAAQETTSGPTTRAVPTTQERLNDLFGLIEGQNSPEVRRTGARELLVQRWAEAPPRLVTLLSGTNNPAKMAVAAALAELPQFLEPTYVSPLIAMLGDEEPDVRTTAGVALAAYRDGGVTPRLRRLALDAEQPRRARLAAVNTLGLMTQREAIDALAEALADPDPAIARAALAALEQATAMSFNEDIAAARKWAEESRALSLESWRQLQVERLVRNNLELRRRLESVEARLAKVLEAGFLRATDAERVTALAGYLADSSSTIRLLGLRLAQKHLEQGKTLPAELSGRIRDLMDSGEPREQAAAARAVASFRESRDADRFLALLKTARNIEVRLAVINGLGYVGTAPAVEPLLTVLGESDEQAATEAAAALGRLAERDVVDSQARDTLVEALLDAFRRTKPTQVALRERVLSAMGRVADPRFGPAFAAALNQTEAIAVRQAAARGIADLNDPQLADALATAVSDPDAGVRKTAVETLALLGATEKHLQALWARLSPAQETDEAIRQAAWRGVLDMLSKRPVDEVEAWLARLPGSERERTEQTLDLLQRLVKAAQEASTEDPQRLGILRARLAAVQARLGQATDAVAEYLKALGNLRTAKSAAAQRVELELLRCALVEGKYDASVAAAMAGGRPAADPDALWQAIKAEVEPRLTADAAALALAMLEAVERHPPGTLAPKALEELQQLRERALKLKRPARESGAESRPVAPPERGWR